MRRIAFVRRGTVAELPKTRHYVGSPPPDGDRTLLPVGAVLVLKSPSTTRNKGVFLFRYTKEGQFAGDTWHASVAEAEEQVKFEYGEDITEWKDVPADIVDEIAFAISQFLKR